MARVTDANAIAVLRPTSIASVQATVGIRCDGWSQVVGTIRIQPSGAGDIEIRVQFADKRDPDEEDWVTTALQEVTPNGGEESWSIRAPVAGVRVRLHISVDDTVEATATILRMAETDLAEASPRGVIFAQTVLPAETQTGSANGVDTFSASIDLPENLVDGDTVDVDAMVTYQPDTQGLYAIAVCVGSGGGVGVKDSTGAVDLGSPVGHVFRTSLHVRVVAGNYHLLPLMTADTWMGTDSWGNTAQPVSLKSNGSPESFWPIVVAPSSASVKIRIQWNSGSVVGDAATLALLSVIVRRP